MANKMGQSTIQAETDRSFIRLLDLILIKNGIKISYRSTPNMNSYDYIHNHKVLNDKPHETEIENCN